VEGSITARFFRGLGLKIDAGSEMQTPHYGMDGGIRKTAWIREGGIFPLIKKA